MKKDKALFVAGLIFTLVALVHLLRIFFQFEVVVSGYILPMWLSVAGILVSSFLAIWMFRAIKSGR